MNNTEIRMNDATDKVVDYMFREEDRHFREWLDEEDNKDPKKFMAKLKEHIFYSVVVMKYRGDAEKINEWANNYWEENGEPDDEDEESEELDDDDDDDDDEEVISKMNSQIEIPVIATPVIHDDILLAKLDKAGLDILINILKDTFKIRISNMKSSSIPLQKRRDLIIKTILEHIVKSPDETLSRKIIDTHFPEKVKIKRNASWLDEFSLHENILFYSNCDRAYIKAKIVEINKASLNIKMYNYTKILDTNAIQNQTYGQNRLIWEDSLQPNKICIRSRNSIIKFGESKWRDDECVEGIQSCDYGN